MKSKTWKLPLASHAFWTKQMSATTQNRPIYYCVLRVHNGIWKTLEGEGVQAMTLKQVSIEIEVGLSLELKM